MTEALLVVVSLLLIVACGAFVAAEFSLLAVNRSSVEALAADGDQSAHGVLAALGTLSTQLSGAQLGITVTNLAIGFLAEPAIAELLRDPFASAGLSPATARTVSVAIALLLATGLTMTFGELVPKNLAIAAPYATAVRVQRFIRAFTATMRYPIKLFNGTANAIVRSLGVEPQEELASARSPEELAGLVRHSASQGTLAPHTAQLVERSLAFGDRKARHVMTPRGQMVTLSTSSTVADLVSTSKQSGLSRFPVMGVGSERDVLGLAHLRKGLQVPFDQRSQVGVTAVMSPISVVPDVMDLDALLGVLRQGGLQVAVLLDEFGDVAGLVTLEDLVEELVGDVRDEHDEADAEPAEDAEGGWLLTAALRPDEASAVIGVHVPVSSRYETLAGLVMVQLGRLAEVGDVVRVDLHSYHDDDDAGTLELAVTAVDGRRIDQVRVRVDTQRNDPAAP